MQLIMALKFTTYGSCQCNAIAQFLVSQPDFTSKYTHVFSKSVHLLSDKELDDLYSNILPIVDMIIVQPVHFSYKNNEKYTTESILKNVKPTCVKICMPYCYFTLYSPSIINIYDGNKKQVDLPIPYHDKLLIQLFMKMGKECVDEYVKAVKADNYLSKESLEKTLVNNINELKKREEEFEKKCDFFVNVSDFIESNYDKELLFHTFNHPTKYLYRYMSDCILNWLGYDNSVYDEIDPHEGLNVPVYKSLSSLVKFDIDKIILMKNKKVMDLEAYAKMFVDFYETYDREILKKYV